MIIRRSPFAVVIAGLALVVAACSESDDPPTGPVVTEVDGFELSLVHHYVHTSPDLDDTEVIPEITLRAPADVDLETLSRARTVDVYFDTRIASALADFQADGGRGVMTFNGPPGANPIAAGTYPGVLIFETTDDRWTFEVQPQGTDVLAPGTLDEPVVTESEVVISWTAPEGPHDWNINLWRYVEVDGQVLELFAEGPSGTSDGSGEALDATFDVSTLEPDEEFVVRLVQSADNTTHRYELELAMPGEEDDEG